MIHILTYDNKISKLSEKLNLFTEIEYFKWLISSVLRYNSRLKFGIGGPNAVLQGLVSGFDKIGVLYKINRANIKKSDTIIVLSGIENLRWAIELKKNNKIRSLLAGPNLITVPDEYSGMIASKYVDLCLVPSDWVRDKYLLREPSLQGRIFVWPVGIDIKYWKPRSKINTNRVLFYIKNYKNTFFLDKLEKIMRDKLGIVVTKLYYDNYKKIDYRDLLQKIDYAIFFTGTESQGIALLESWASNVPTVVVRAENWTSASGHVYKASSAPYLSDETGFFIGEDCQSINFLINNISKITDLHPRNYAEKFFSDEVCSKRLYQAILDLQ